MVEGCNRQHIVVRALDMREVEELRVAISEYHSVLKQQEILWLAWLRGGDNDSSFFHKITVALRRENKNICLMARKSRMRGKFVRHSRIFFESRWSITSANESREIPTFERRLDTTEAPVLTRPVA